VLGGVLEHRGQLVGGLASADDALAGDGHGENPRP
jgi:hypothetical protein